MSYKPLHDFMLVKIQKKKKKSSILYIPEDIHNLKQHTCLGMIIDVGDEVSGFKKNDFTLYAIEEGIQHPEDASLLFIREKYCLLKVEREGGAYQEVD